MAGTSQYVVSGYSTGYFGYGENADAALVATPSTLSCVIGRIRQPGTVTSGNANYRTIVGTSSGGMVQGSLNAIPALFGQSLYDASGAYIQSSTSFSISGNFTLEFWFYVKTPLVGGDILGFIGGIGGSDYIDLSASSGLRFRTAIGGTATVSTQFQPLTNTWHHIAWVRNGATVSLYFNGQLAASDLVSGTISGNVGVGDNGGSAPDEIAYDEIALWNGTAKYTAPFTPTGPIVTSLTNAPSFLVIGNTLLSPNTFQVIDQNTYSFLNYPKQQYSIVSTVSKVGGGLPRVSATFQALSDLTSAITVDAVITNVLSTELFAFSDAALVADVENIKGTSCDTFSTFIQDCIVEIIAGGEIVEAYGIWESSLSLDAAPSATKPFSSIQETACSLTAIISHIEGADLQAFNTASLSIQLDLFKGLSSAISSEFGQTTNNIRLKDLSSSIASEFSQTTNNIRPRLFEGLVKTTYFEDGYYTDEGIPAADNYYEKVNAYSVLTAVGNFKLAPVTHQGQATISAITTVSSNLTAIYKASSDLEFIAQQDTTASITRSTSVDISSITTQEATAILIIDGTSAMSAAFIQTSTITHINGLDLFAFTEAKIDIVVDRIRSTNVEASTYFNLATDGKVTKYLSADVDAIASLYSVASRSRIAKADFNSAFSIDVSAIKVQGENTASLNVTIDLTATGKKFVGFTVSLVVTASNLTIGESGKIAEAHLSSSLSIDCTITKVLGPITSNLSTEFTQYSVPTITRTTSAELYVDGFIVAGNGRIRPEVADLTSTATLVSTVIVHKEYSASLDTTSTTACTITKEFGIFTAILTSDTSLSITALSLPSGAVAGYIDAILDITPNRIRDNNANLEVAGFELATVSTSRGLEAHLESSLTVSANILRIKQLSADLATQASELVIINKIGNTLVDAAVISTLHCDLGTIRREIALEVADFNLTASISHIKGITAGLNSNSALGVTAGKQVEASASLQALAFELSIARSIRLDNADTYRVPADNNYWRVPRDINLDDAIVYTVPRDIRTWLVPQDNNYYTVEFENRTFKIKG